MCGRYSLFFDDEYNRNISEIMKVIKSKYPNTDIKSGEIFPTNTAPVLIEQNSSVAPVPYKWGFPNFRNKGVIINARAETAGEKKTFKDSLLKRRCVIPSTGFYEWDKSKQKYLFNIQGRNALYMAGFYNLFKDEPRFIILTTEANSSVSSIHHRMPVVLEKQQIEREKCRFLCGVPGRSGPLERNSVPCREGCREGHSKAAQKFRAVREGFFTKGEKVPARYYAPVLFVLKYHQ